MQRIYIHAGYPKCASTTLQKHLFNSHPKFAFLGQLPSGNIGFESSSDKAPNLAINSSQIQELHELFFLDNYDANRTELKKRITQILKPIFEGDKIPVLSNELLTAYLYDNITNYERAQRINDVFPEARIILVARDPLNWLVSQYRDQPFDPSDIKGSKYIQFDNWILKMRECRSDILDALKYEEVLNHYESLFGAENVKMLLFQDLIDHPIRFYSELALFLGIPRNEVEELLSGKRENTGTSDAFTRYRILTRKLKHILPVNNTTRNLRKKIDQSVKGFFPKKKREVSYSSDTKSWVDMYYSDTCSFLERLKTNQRN